MANIFEINRPANKITLGTTGTTINIASHTASKILALDGSKDLEVVTIGTSLDYTRPTLNTVQDIRTTASPEFAGGTFTGVVIGVTPTAGNHLVTKEYLDLALGAFKTFFLSDTGSGVGDLNYAYPHETTEPQSEIVNDGGGEAYDVGEHLVQGFITEVGEPGTTTIHEGVISFHFHAKKGNSNQKTTTLHAVLSRVDADGTTGKVEIVETEVSGELTDTELTFDIHAVVSEDVEVADTGRLILEVYATVSGVTQDVVVTLYMEGTEDSYFTTKVDSGIWQNHGDVLDDLNIVGQVGADSEFLVGTGIGALAWENAATARTSLGLGTGDSPLFTAISVGNADTTITRVGAGVIAVEGVTVAMVGDAPTAHSIASHNDTTGTGAELNTLTDGSDAGALHSHAAAYQPLDAVLTDLAALAAVANNEFIVGTGAGTYAHENAATAATSMGLGVGDSPTFSNLTVSNVFSVAGLSTTGDTQLGDNVALDNVGINVAPDANVLIKGSFASTGSGTDFCYNNELFTHTEDDSTANTFIYGTNSSMTVNDDLTVDGTFTAIGHKQFLEAGLTTMTGVGDPVAYLYGYHAVVDWAAAPLGAANYAAIVVGFKANVTGNLGTVGNTIKWGVDISVSESAVTHYGGRFTAQGATYNYGVWGYATGAHTTNFGLYGYAAGATTNWGLYVAAGDAFFAGNIVMPNNGTIGQSAGPLLTFDDDNNYLEITGCKVGIGTLAPTHELSTYGIIASHVGTNAETHERFRLARATTPTVRYHSIFSTTSGASAIENNIIFKVHDAVSTTSQTDVLILRGDGSVVLPNGPLFIKEQASADGDTAVYGQIWIKNTDPQEIWFTDGDGNHHQLAYVV